MNTKKEQMTALLDPPLARFVEQRAAEEDRSQAAIIRRLVAEAARRQRDQEAVRTGTVEASSRWAHSVHIEVTDLEPGRPYWYRFIALGEASPVGLARTAPEIGKRAGDQGERQHLRSQARPDAEARGLGSEALVRRRNRQRHSPRRPARRFHARPHVRRFVPQRHQRRHVVRGSRSEDRTPATPSLPSVTISVTAPTTFCSATIPLATLGSKQSATVPPLAGTRSAAPTQATP
jgi:PhoD-like phosphatase, N-terminal domain